VPLRRVYWDSCVFLSYLNETPDRAPHIEALLTQAEAGKLEIVTSTVTIAEVAFAASEQISGALDPQIEAKIVALWGPPIRMVEFHAPIGARAAQLVRDAMLRKTGLKPMDAIHLATAEQVGVHEFHSYDDLNRFKPPVRFPILAVPLENVQSKFPI
jgi:predicted nucleic acid-binding protein